MVAIWSNRRGLGLPRRAVVVGLALALLGEAPRASASDPDPVAVFRDGERIIAENHAEIVDATYTGMLRGAARIEEALALGYRNRFKALRLLGYAYSQVYSREGIDQELCREKAQRAYEEAARLRPRDTAVLMELAGVQVDQLATVDALRRVLRVDPGHADALFALGTTLLNGIHGNVLFTREERAAQVEEGAKLLKRAAARMKGTNARVLRREIASLLEGASHKADADEIRRKYGLEAE